MRIRDYPNSYRRGGAGLGFQGPGPSGPGGRPPPGSTAPPPAPPQPRIPSNPQKRFPMPTPGQLARRRLLDMLPPYRAGKAIQYGTKIALKIAEYYLEHPDQYAGPKALGPDVIESNGWCVPQWCPSRPPGNTTGVASFGGPCPTPPIEKCMAPQYMTEQPFFIAVRGTWGHGCWMTGPDDFGRYLITHWWKLPYYDPGRPAPVPLPELVPGVAVPVLEPSPWPDVWPDLYPPNVPRPRPAPPPIHFVPHLPELPGREGGNEPRPANPWAPTIPKPNGQQDNGWRPPQVAPPYAPPVRLSRPGRRDRRRRNQTSGWAGAFNDATRQGREAAQEARYMATRHQRTIECGDRKRRPYRRGSRCAPRALSGPARCYSTRKVAGPLSPRETYLYA